MNTQKIKLTDNQLKKIKNGENLKFTKKQTEKIIDTSQKGGFLQFLLPGLIALGKAAALGSAGAAASYGTTKLINKATGSGCKNKNSEIKKKRGKGPYQIYEKL